MINGTGLLAVGDFERLIQGIVDASAWGYAKLFDGMDPMLEMSTADMLEVGVRCRMLHDQLSGPLAIVLDVQKREKALRLLGLLAVAERPMRLFTDQAQARRWLASTAGTPALHPRRGVVEPKRRAKG